MDVKKIGKIPDGGGWCAHGRPATKDKALRRAERWRWQAVVRADLTAEMRAVRAIGTLQERQGDQEAIASYVRSGAGEKAEAAADALPEQPAHIDTRLLRGQSRRRATAYMAAARAADSGR
jgi:hypothetical protein